MVTISCGQFPITRPIHSNLPGERNSIDMHKRVNVYRTAGEVEESKSRQSLQLEIRLAVESPHICSQVSLFAALKNCSGWGPVIRRLGKVEIQDE